MAENACNYCRVRFASIVCPVCRSTLEVVKIPAYPVVGGTHYAAQERAATAARRFESYEWVPTSVGDKK